MTIGVVIPLFNEEENLTELYRRLSTSLKHSFPKSQYHVVFVDDGSVDHTFELIQRITKKDRGVTGIQLSRNFGQHHAITAGLSEVKADYIAIMDGDMQDNPDELLRFYTKLQKGYDLVLSVRVDRQDPLFKKFTSFLFWRLLSGVTGLNIPANQSMLKMFNIDVLKAVLSFKETQRFYAGIFTWIGFRQTTIEVRHSKRYKGRSKYTLSKMFRLMLTAMLSFSNVPLYNISVFGMLLAVVSGLYGCFVVLDKIVFHVGVSGWASMTALISFIGGMIIFSIGVLGIYLGKIHEEAMRRPEFIVRRRTK